MVSWYTTSSGVINTPTNKALLDLHRGCNRIVTGLCIHVFFMLTGMTLPLMEALYLPSYLLGSLIVFWGVFTLPGHAMLTEHWRFIVGMLKLAAFGFVYFCPFFYWWTHQPDAVFLAVNALFFCLSYVVVLTMLNQLSAEYATYDAHFILLAESHISAWTTCFFYGGILVVAGGFALLQVWQQGSPPLPLIHEQLQHIPLWAVFFLLLPYTLTLINVLRINALCLNRIQNS